MATIKDLVVKIVADTTGLDSGLKSASKNIKDVGDKSGDASEKSKGLSQQFGALKTALVSAGLIAAFVAVGKAIADSVKEFAAAELASKRLDAVATMRGLKDGVSRITDLANELQNLTGVSDDYVKQLASELLAQGKTLDQTEELIRAASQLSAITGDDLGTSVKQLTNTYSGMAGTIGRAIPEIKDLTAEQLKNGDAIKIINEKYSGFAETLTNTVDVATKRAGQNFGDLKEILGQAFAPMVVQGANALTSAINAMKPTLEYMATHSFDRAFQELFESIFKVKGEYTLWEEAMKSAKDAEIEANRATANRAEGMKALQKDIANTIAKTAEMADGDLQAARDFLYAQMQRSSSMDALTQAQKKLDAYDTEIAKRRQKEADEVAAKKKAASEKSAAAAAESAAKEAEARKKKEQETRDYITAQEDAISKRKADAYGDSIVKAAEEEQARIDSARRIEEQEALSSQEISALKAQMYDAIKAAAQSINDITQSNAQAAMDAIDKETEAAIAAGADEVEAKKEGEKKKAKIKYDADMWSWGTNLALAAADAARSIIVGYAQLGPIGGSIAAAITAGVTAFQIGAMIAAKPVAPAFARGTDFAPGGTALVGEEGPEIVTLPRGASVTPNTRGGGSTGHTFIFNSPVALTPSEMETRMTRAARDMAFEGVI